MTKIIGRILALDIGEVRVGTSICDPLGITTHSPGYVTGEGRKEKIARIIEIIKEYEPVLILVGLPLNMDGTRGESAKKALKFMKLLNRETELPIKAIDERLTTKEAERLLKSSDVSISDRREVIDGMAASLILQKYLDSLQNDEEEEEEEETGTTETPG